VNRQQRNAVGERLQTARWEARLSLRAAAAAVDRAVNAIVEYEHGAVPDAGTRTGLAALYGIDEDVLFAEYELVAAGMWRTAVKDMLARLDKLEFETEELFRSLGEHIDDEGYPDGFAHGKIVRSSVDGADFDVVMPLDALGGHVEDLAARVESLERRLDGMADAARR
jgi:transcriptional regulator with XRE-family HTH domain